VTSFACDKTFGLIDASPDALVGLDAQGALFVQGQNKTQWRALDGHFDTFSLCPKGTKRGGMNCKQSNSDDNIGKVVAVGQKDKTLYSAHVEPEHQKWLPLRPHLNADIVGLACGKGGLWAIDSGHGVFHLPKHSAAWTRVPGTLKQISSGKETWGVSPSNQVLKWEGNGTWGTVPGSLEFVSAAEDGTVWGVGGVNNLFQYSADKKAWNFVEGAFTRVAAADQHLAYGLSPAGEVWSIRT
jgi:hypothetical protein